MINHGRAEAGPYADCLVGRRRRGSMDVGGTLHHEIHGDDKGTYMTPFFNRNDSGKTLPNIHKIAVLRANALGDFLFTLPALEALRNAYPQAEIVLLAKEWHRAFLAKRPSPVDRVIVLPPYAGVSAEVGSEENELELEQFFHQMEREHFDLAVQLQGGGGHSNPFVRKLHAKLAVGPKAPDAIALDRWVPYTYFQSEIMRYLEVVSLVGATPTTVEPRIVVTEEDSAEARRVVAEDARPLIVLHPGASDVRRRWSPRKFARLGDALGAQGARVVATGVKEEAATVLNFR
jgi:ADP-heptose:LPS heptosyltransferase